MVLPVVGLGFIGKKKSVTSGRIIGGFDVGVGGEAIECGCDGVPVKEIGRGFEAVDPGGRGVDIEAEPAVVVGRKKFQREGLSWGGESEEYQDEERPKPMLARTGRPRDVVLRPAGDREIIGCSGARGRRPPAPLYNHTESTGRNVIRRAGQNGRTH